VDDRRPSAEGLEASGDDGGPLGEVPVVRDACFATVNQAARKPCPEDSVDSQCGQDCGLLLAELVVPSRDPFGEFGIEPVDQGGVGGVESD
jgi:hypothetical protein